ncbi:MAG: DNA-binding protein, partial [Bdellovibrio sp.]
MQVISIPGFSEPVSSLTHLLAAIAAFLGAIFLLRKGRGNKLRLLALGIYSFSLVFLFSMSGVYHLLDPKGAPRMVFQRLDHAGIWVLIAGTFTPLHVIAMRGFWRWGVVLSVWTLAITGLTLEVVFFQTIPEWLILLFFLGFGWVGFLTAYKLRKIYGLREIQ